MDLVYILRFCVFFPMVLAYGYRRPQHPEYRRPHMCFPIQNPLCIGFGYNFTTMPNILKHDSQAEASDRLREFQPLIDVGCSKYLRFFLCSLHFPMCDTQVTVAITSCRRMCKIVRSGCAPIMEGFGVKWPDNIDCDQLLEGKDENSLCMQPPNLKSPDNNSTKVDHEQGESVEIEKSATEEDTPNVPAIADVDEPGHGKSGQNSAYPDEETIFNEFPPDTDTDHHTRIEVPPGFNEDETDLLLDQSSTANKDPSGSNSVDDKDQSLAFAEDPRPEHGKDKVKKSYQCGNPQKYHYLTSTRECMPRCDADTDVLFSGEHKWFAYCLLTVFASLCFASTAATVCTFAIDRKRFRYPERPIIFLSLCYCLYSIAYLMRSFRGPLGSVSCAEATNADTGDDVHHLVKNRLGGSECTATFFMLYYFGMAASAWWIVLTLSWLLSAGFKWGHEAIEAYGLYFHLVCWSLPAALTAAVLVLGKVDGDELTGLCYVGNLDPDSLMYFVIIPLTFYLLTGTVSLTLGFGYLFKIRRVIKHQYGDAAFNLEKLMLRIGLFSVLYIVPAACVLAVNFYQYQNFSTWTLRAQTVPCKLIRQAGESYYESKFKQEDYRNYPGYMPPSDKLAISNPAEGWSSYSNKQSQYSESAAYEEYHDKPIHNAPHENNWLNPGVPTHDVKARSISKKMTGVQEDPDFMNSDSQLTSGTASGHSSKDGYLDCTLTQSIPSLPIFAIKIFMSLLAGIASGMWIWSAKTIDSWKAFFQTCSKCYRGEEIATPDAKRHHLTEKFERSNSTIQQQGSSSELACQQLLKRDVSQDFQHGCHQDAISSSSAKLLHPQYRQLDGSSNAGAYHGSYVLVPCVRSQSQLTSSHQQQNFLCSSGDLCRKERSISPLVCSAVTCELRQQNSCSCSAAHAKKHHSQYSHEELQFDRFRRQHSTTSAHTSDQFSNTHINSRSEEAENPTLSTNLLKYNAQFSTNSTKGRNNLGSIA